MTFALIRHGQTDWNLQGRMQGRTDIPLNATGRDQAMTAGRRIADSGDGWDLVVSSPLGRARETASIIAETLRVPLEGEYEDLVEQDFGEAEGSLVTDALAQWPDRFFPGMESDEAVGPRGVEALGRIQGDHGSARVLVVAHGTFIRHTMSTISGHHFSRFPRLENTSMSTLLRNERDLRVSTVGGVPLELALLQG